MHVNGSWSTPCPLHRPKHEIIAILTHFLETVTCFLVFSSCSFTLASDFNTACSVNNDKTSYCAEKHAPTCDFNRKIDRIEYFKGC
jgi:hypothetical protein